MTFFFSGFSSKELQTLYKNSAVTEFYGEVSAHVLLPSLQKLFIFLPVPMVFIFFVEYFGILFFMYDEIKPVNVAAGAGLAAVMDTHIDE